MHKAVSKTNVILRYMEALALPIGAPTVNWEDNTSCIYVLEDKRVTPRVKQIYIPVYFLQEQFENDLFNPKYEKSGVIPEDMCTKSCPGPITSRSTKLMTGLRIYPTSVT